MTASSAARLPWTSESRTTRCAPAGRKRRVVIAGPLRRDDEGEKALARDLAVDARDAAALAEPAAELLHRDLEPERVARDDDPLEADLVDPREQPDPVAEPGLGGHVAGHRLGERLDLDDARHHRQAREVALEEPLGRGHGLDPDDPLLGGLVLHDPVHEEERPAVRDQRLDLAGRVDDAGRGERVGGCWRRSLVAPAGSGRVCPTAARAAAAGVRAGVHGVSVRRRSRRAPGAARNAALPTRSRRLVVNRPRGTAQLEQRGGSPRW